MNQTELMQRFIDGDLDGTTLASGSLHIKYDGGGGRLVCDEREIAIRHHAYDETSDTFVTDRIIVAEKLLMPTTQYRAAAKLIGVMDDMGYRNAGTEPATFDLGYTKRLMDKANVYRHKRYRHKDRKKDPTMDDVFVKVKPFDEEDWQGFVEQAWDAGSGNMQVHSVGIEGYIVTILNDDGSTEMTSFASRERIMQVAVMYGSFDRYEMFEKKFDHIIIDLGQIDIWDASNIWQIAAFGDVIIS